MIPAKWQGLHHIRPGAGASIVAIGASSIGAKQTDGGFGRASGSRVCGCPECSVPGPRWKINRERQVLPLPHRAINVVGVRQVDVGRVVHHPLVDLFGHPLVKAAVSPVNSRDSGLPVKTLSTGETAKWNVARNERRARCALWPAMTGAPSNARCRAALPQDSGPSRSLDPRPSAGTHRAQG